MDCENDSGSKEVWVLCYELSGDMLVGLQSPGCVMSAAIQLVYLSIKKTKTINNDFTDKWIHWTH